MVIFYQSIYVLKKYIYRDLVASLAFVDRAHRHRRHRSRHCCLVNASVNASENGCDLQDHRDYVHGTFYLSIYLSIPCFSSLFS